MVSPLHRSERIAKMMKFKTNRGWSDDGYFTREASTKVAGHQR